MRRSRSRAAAGATSAILFAGVLPVGLASPAAAGPIICNEGYVHIAVWDISKTNKITHLSDRIRIDPGATFSKTVTRTRQRTYGAGIEGSLEATAGADAIIAKGEVKAGIKMQVSGSWTYRKDVSSGWSMTNSTKKSQVWVLYRGTKVVRGAYKRKRCVNNGQSWAFIDKGRWRSWNYEERGAVKCPSSARKKGSLPWLALKARGC